MHLTVPEKKPADSSNKQLQLIVKDAKSRSFDLSRLYFAFSQFEEPRTTLYRLPLEIDMSLLCDDCQIIRGSDLK